MNQEPADQTAEFWQTEVARLREHFEEQIAALEQHFEERMAALEKQVGGAHWRINDEKDHLSLQIELGNDYAVTLDVSDEDGPTTTLWYSSLEHSFEWDNRASFRAWLDRLASAQ